MKYTKKLVKEMLLANYEMLYYPMTEEIKQLFPVVTVDDCSEYFGFHFTTKHTGKMRGMDSLSTTCKVNDLCIARINSAFSLVLDNFDISKATAEEIKTARKLLTEHLKNHPENENISVCGFCFSDRQQDFMSSMKEPLTRNYQILNNGVIHADWLPVINSLVFRGEAFGDFGSENAVINMVNLVKKNSNVFFGIWSKNLNFWDKVFKGGKKPDNMNLVISSQFINKKVNVPEKYRYLVDMTFTVYTKEFAEENNITINCGALSCLNCLKCYKKNGVKDIAELLK